MIIVGYGYNRVDCDETIRFDLKDITTSERFLLERLGGVPTADSPNKDGMETWWFDKEVR